MIDIEEIKSRERTEAYSIFSNLDRFSPRLARRLQSISFNSKSADLGATCQEEISEVPFLSVVTRTQGKRMGTLRDVIHCLIGQSEQSYEHLIVLHNVSVETAQKIVSLIRAFPEDYQSKVQLLRVSGGTRTRPLNAAFSMATARYAAILDDDDLVLDHWIETFKSAARRNPGQVIRTVAVAQDFQEASIMGGDVVARSTSSMRVHYPTNFRLVQHLLDNESPPICIAYPLSAFRDLGIQFDQHLNTREDWDFFLRTSTVCGVVSVEIVTAIYRQWIGSESSQTAHSASEWNADYQRIVQKLNDFPFVLPPGSIESIQQFLEVGRPYATARPKDMATTHLELEVTAVLQSRSWKLTSLLRTMSRLLGRPRYVVPDYRSFSHAELQKLLQALYSSLSWKLTAPLRKVLQSVSHEGNS